MTTLTVKIERKPGRGPGCYYLKKFANGRVVLVDQQGTPNSLSNLFLRQAEEVLPGLEASKCGSEMVAAIRAKGDLRFWDLTIIADVPVHTPAEKVLTDLVEQIGPHVRAADIDLASAALLRLLADRIEQAGNPRGHRRLEIL